MPAGDSQQARENRQANQREQEASRRQAPAPPTTTTTTTASTTTASTSTTSTAGTTNTDATTVDPGLEDQLNGVIPGFALSAPTFAATNMDGTSRGRPDLIGHPTVLWFYPLAETPG